MAALSSVSDNSKFSVVSVSAPVDCLLLFSWRYSCSWCGERFSSEPWTFWVLWYRLCFLFKTVATYFWHSCRRRGFCFLIAMETWLVKGKSRGYLENFSKFLRVLSASSPPAPIHQFDHLWPWLGLSSLPASRGQGDKSRLNLLRGVG